MIKRILVGLSGTPFTPVAVQHAIELAQAHGAELKGITVVEATRLSNVGPVPIGGGEYARRTAQRRLKVTQEQIEKAIGAFEKACSATGIRPQTERETGDPFDLLVSHARYHDLIVFGLRGLFDYGILDQPRDVLVRLVSQGVRPIVAVASHYRPIRRVLIAYSGSLEAAKAMKRFIQLQPWPNVAVKIACFDKKRNEAERLLTEAAAYCRAHGIDPEVEYQPGPPKERLLPCAKQYGADLIVMGNSFRNLILRHLLGGTMLHTIQHADRPLFLSQ